MKFNGYLRKDGKVGVRNHLLIMPVSHYANHVTKKISKGVHGSVYFTHQHGTNQQSKDLTQTRKVMEGFAAHPNVYGVIIVGYGNDLIDGEKLMTYAKKNYKEAYYINIKDLGGVNNSILKGKEIGSVFLENSLKVPTEECDIDKLILGTECGGSDALSGIAANPAVGKCSDILIKHGGTSLLSETMELVGAEHLLAERAIDENTKNKLLSVVNNTEKGAMEMGVDIRGTQPARGNIEGGISTIEEKSLGCIKKGGTTSLVDVIDYADQPSKKGLVLMDTPGHDIEQLTGMAAGGAQVCLFTTGRGTPAGSPICPVIKISSNTPMYNRMKLNIDLNAGEIVSGEETVDSIGEQLFELVLSVCNGAETKSEILKHNEFGIFTIERTV